MKVKFEVGMMVMYKKELDITKEQFEKLKECEENEFLEFINMNVICTEGFETDSEEYRDVDADDCDFWEVKDEKDG